MMRVIPAGEAFQVQRKLNATLLQSDRSAFASHVDRLVKDNAPLNFLNVSTVLYRSQKLAVRVLSERSMKYLLKAVRNDDDTYPPRTLSSSLYGLQRYPDSPTLRQLILELVGKGRRSLAARGFSASRLGGQAVQMSIIGSQGQGPTTGARAVLQFHSEKACSSDFDIR
eukprot:Hpha_TRINITY_DN24255_c0_g1::TRINITY_DN24255_c0_g1_i1::g.36113::m.36113